MHEVVFFAPLCALTSLCSAETCVRAVYYIWDCDMHFLGDKAYERYSYVGVSICGGMPPQGEAPFIFCQKYI